MKQVILFLFVNSFTTLALAAPPSIPKQFQGEWSTTEACALIAETGPQIEVTATEINRIEHWCKLKKVTGSDKTGFVGLYSCTIETGDQSTETISVSLNPKGELIVANETAVPRCR